MYVYVWLFSTLDFLIIFLRLAPGQSLVVGFVTMIHEGALLLSMAQIQNLKSVAICHLEVFFLITVPK